MKIKFIILGVFVVCFVLFFSFVITDYIQDSEDISIESPEEEVEQPLTYLYQEQSDQVSKWKTEVRKKIEEYEITKMGKGGEE